MSSKFQTSLSFYQNSEFNEALMAVAGERGDISKERLGKWLSKNANRTVNLFGGQGGSYRFVKGELVHN